MPTVPTPNRRVDLKPLPGARLTAAETPLSSGQETAQAEAGFFGAGVEAATRGYSAVVKEAKQRADETALLNASNQLSSWTTNALYGQDGALTKKGQDAFDQPEKLRAGYTDVVGKISQGLGNDDQRFAFQKLALQHGASLDLTIQRHVAEQRTAYEGDELQKFTENRVSDAVANSQDPAAIGQAVDAGLGAIKLHGPRLGLGPEALDAAERAFTTRVHTGVIDALLEQDHTDAAQVYYEETKHAISGEAQTRIEKALDSAGTDKDGLRIATDLWTRLGPKPGDDESPIAIDAMEEAARQQYADDPKRLKSTMAWLRERKASVEAGRKEREDATLSTLWSAVTKGATLSDVRTLPAYQQAPGKVQAQISDYIVQKAEHAANLAYTAEARAAARESRQYTQEQRAEAQKERAGTFRFFQLLDGVHQMSDGQIWATVPEIGERNAAKLLEEKRRRVADPKVLDDFRSDTAVINGVLEQAHIDPSPPRSSGDYEAQIANLGWFREQVAAEQNRVQDVTKKKVTNDELAAIAKRILGQQVLRSGSVPFTFGLVPWGQASVPLMSATIADVPSKDYDAIKTSPEWRGATPTDDQILAVWRSVQLRKK